MRKCSTFLLLRDRWEPGQYGPNTRAITWEESCSVGLPVILMAALQCLEHNDLHWAQTSRQLALSDFHLEHLRWLWLALSIGGFWWDRCQKYSIIMIKQYKLFTEELEVGQVYRLDNGLEITSVKRSRSCVKKVSTATEQHRDDVSQGFPWWYCGPSLRWQNAGTSWADIWRVQAEGFSIQVWARWRESHQRTGPRTEGSL